MQVEKEAEALLLDLEALETALRDQLAPEVPSVDAWPHFPQAPPKLKLRDEAAPSAAQDAGKAGAGSCEVPQEEEAAVAADDSAEDVPESGSGGSPAAAGGAPDEKMTLRCGEECEAAAAEDAAAEAAEEAAYLAAADAEREKEAAAEPSTMEMLEETVEEADAAAAEGDAGGGAAAEEGPGEGESEEEYARGEKLFKKLEKLNSQVKRAVYRKKGVWNFVTLEHDIAECGGAGFDIEGAELYAELQRLNAILEKKGVKAFGDLEASMYQKPDGEWVEEALEEDVKVCLEELALQGVEEAAGGVSNAPKKVRTCWRALCCVLLAFLGVETAPETLHPTRLTLFFDLFFGFVVVAQADSARVEKLAQMFGTKGEWAVEADEEAPAPAEAGKLGLKGAPPLSLKGGGDAAKEEKEECNS